MERVWDFVKDNMVKHGCTPKEISQFLVIVEELFVNVVHYAYQDKEGDIEMKLTFFSEPDRIVFTIIDSGMPFNPFSRKDPDITLDGSQRQIGGLGIFLSKKLSDKQFYSYEDGKNKVTIEKNIDCIRW